MNVDFQIAQWAIVMQDAFPFVANDVNHVVLNSGLVRVDFGLAGAENSENDPAHQKNVAQAKVLNQVLQVAMMMKKKVGVAVYLEVE